MFLFFNRINRGPNPVDRAAGPPDVLCSQGYAETIATTNGRGADHLGTSLMRRRAGQVGGSGCARRGRSKGIRPGLEALERRDVPAAIPAASLSLPSQALIGETLNFS